MKSPANKWIVYKAARPTTSSKIKRTPIFVPRNFSAAVNGMKFIDKVIENEKFQKYLNETRSKILNTSKFKENYFFIFYREIEEENSRVWASGDFGTD